MLPPEPAASSVASIAVSATGLTILGISTGLQPDILLAGFAGGLWALTYQPPAPTVAEGSVYSTIIDVNAMLWPALTHVETRFADLTGSPRHAMAIRITNNVLQAYVSWVGGSTSYELLTPVSMHGLSAVFPTYYGASFIRYASYNPKTHALMGNGAITGAISWI